MKGYYIPPALPQTEQAKFFQQNRDLDEQKLRDAAFIARQQRKNKFVFLNSRSKT